MNTKGLNRPLSRQNFNFLKLWLKKPTSVGAVMPSSKSLATAMAQEVDLSADGYVVELGGGTGNITAALLSAGVEPERLIVVEQEASLCGVIADRFPHVKVICGDACELDSLLANAGVDQVKAVVSGLPLLSLKEGDCWKILSRVFQVLQQDGNYVQFTYGPRSPIPRAMATAMGIAGRRSNWILDNLPPASVWCYRDARAAQNLRQTA